jgi:hypothetical protein
MHCIYIYIYIQCMFRLNLNLKVHKLVSTAGLYSSTGTTATGSLLGWYCGAMCVFGFYLQ